jgi:hypothetical protein
MFPSFTVLLRELRSEVRKRVKILDLFGFGLFHFWIPLKLLAVGTSWLSGRGRGRNGVKKSAVVHWFAKES